MLNSPLILVFFKELLLDFIIVIPELSSNLCKLLIELLINFTNYKIAVKGLICRMSGNEIFLILINTLVIVVDY